MCVCHLLPNGVGGLGLRLATADETEIQPLFPGFQIAFPHSLTLSHSTIIIMTR
jgi:hypothetical protein